MSRFHNYSFGNVLEIARQRPTATRVAGLYAWNQLGRKVKKGEKGIRILAPIIGIRRKTDEEAEKDTHLAEQARFGWLPQCLRLRCHRRPTARSFPRCRRCDGDAGENRDRLLRSSSSQGIELVFTENIAPAMGVSYGGRIAILPGQSEGRGVFARLCMKSAHELLHKAERRTTTTKTVKETEAEAVAFVVGKAVGLQRWAARLLTISSFTTATLRFWPRAWKSSSRPPPSSLPHCSRRPQNKRRCPMQNWRRWHRPFSRPWAGEERVPASVFTARPNRSKGACHHEHPSCQRQ